MIPGTKKYMLDCSFWVNKIEDRNITIMDINEIDRFNANMFSNLEYMHIIEEYKESLTRAELLKLIESYRIPEAPRYDVMGEEVGKEFYDKLLENLNLEAIEERNLVRFGIAVKSTRIRSFPTDEGVFKAPEDVEFDRFQESECQAIEPVAILHESLDGEWLFIHMYNYKGWVRKEDIAIARDRRSIIDYLDTRDFLVVTGNRVSTQFSHYDHRISRKDFYMGTRIPLSSEFGEDIGNQTTLNNYVVKLPVRDEAGMLELKDALLSPMEDVRIGYMPYTREAILQQAFKLQGDRYDWGNKNNGRDCSGFVLSVYKTFGIRLPRNADQQEMAGGVFYSFDENTSVEEKINCFKKAKPGAAIFMEGHVMMYLGEDNDEHYMIHAFHKYGALEGNEIKAICANEVAVTSTMLLTVRGKSFLEEFTGIELFE